MEQEQDTGPAVEPRPLSEILGSRRETAPREEAPAGQPERNSAAPTTAETGEPKTDRTRDDAGRFAPAQDAAPPAAAKEAEDGRLAAVKAERQRRQEAERRAEALERQLRDFQTRQTAPQAPAQPAQPAAPEADFWADPEGYVGKVREQLRADMERQSFESRIALSVEMVKSQNPDYPEAEAALHDHVQEAEASGDPVKMAQAQAIRAAIKNATNPAAVALQLGRQAKALREHGNDPEAMFRAAVEREVAKRMAEAKAPEPAQPETDPAPRLPGSLAGVRATATRSASSYSGPRPLSAILGPRR